jgi:hypothetical protein
VTQASLARSSSLVVSPHSLTVPHLTMPPADDSELMIDHSSLAQEDSHIVLDLHDSNDLKEPMVDAQGQYKDGADVFGPKMQQLRLQLLQQNEEFQKLRESPIEPPQQHHTHAPHNKRDVSVVMKALSLAVWFCFNSLTLILNKYVFRFIFSPCTLKLIMFKVLIFSSGFPLPSHAHCCSYVGLLLLFFPHHPSFQVGPVPVYV